MQNFYTDIYFFLHYPQKLAVFQNLGTTSEHYLWLDEARPKKQRKIYNHPETIKEQTKNAILDIGHV